MRTDRNDLARFFLRSGVRLQRVLAKSKIKGRQVDSGLQRCLSGGRSMQKLAAPKVGNQKNKRIFYLAAKRNLAQEWSRWSPLPRPHPIL